MQPKFSYSVALAGAALFAAIIACGELLGRLPDREPAPPTLAALDLEPVEISRADLAPIELVGAWRLSSPEPRFGGISGLAVDGAGIVAVTDAGATVRFPKRLGARMQLRVLDLPAGPGDPGFKMNRDSEALLRDPGGRGWWIPFENHDELWLFDHGFERDLRRIKVPDELLTQNAGIEALAGDGSVIFAFPESGGRVLRWGAGGWTQGRLDSRTAISDAVSLDGGRLFLVERRITVAGFENNLALVGRNGAGFRTIWRKQLPVAWRDNLEAIAAEPLHGGGYRLWILSDDNFHPRLRTLLLVVDVPAAALPKRL